MILIFCLESEAQSNYEERRSTINTQQQTTRSQIEDLQQQIENYSERLGYASQRYDQMYRQYEELTRVIALQEEKLRQMRREQSQIQEEINLVQNELNELEAELTALIDEYKSTLTYIYKHGRTTELALLLTSSSINQLMVRSYYLRRFDQHRQEQAEEIEDAQREMEQAYNDLENARERNRESLVSIERETEELFEQEEQQKRNVELLQRDRDNLESQVQIRQNQLDELTETLNSLIAEEQRLEEAEAERLRRLEAASRIEDDDERRAAEARYSAPIGRVSPVTGDELAVFESEFENLRGRMPWPVDNGLITERFGERIHPVFGTRTNVPGVDIAASPRSNVRAVSDGFVFEIVPVSDFGDVVLIKHGSYYTAYGNLSNIYVRRNQVVNQNDVIGLSGDEDNIRGEVLLFMVREGNEFVNPENWLQEALQ
ncbi:murein hydrolase activator EnvC [Rhodohalobacter sp. SW132]|uniref:murein hydrolase activator EnvC family protein n=1 Tax=Rhodohalobacter sp. SW132 TaxID=2293433 RepID=UPI0013145C55|nr:peptidoglycan DD-metalloendopeptidase family protein [Rhodohalobacter sp. SW132]